jgi:hypothetical protein
MDLDEPHSWSRSKSRGEGRVPMHALNIQLCRAHVRLRARKNLPRGLGVPEFAPTASPHGRILSRGATVHANAHR